MAAIVSDVVILLHNYYNIALAVLSLLTTPLYTGSCYSYQFRCDSGQCVDSTLACNGISYDCSDNSDESGCSCKLGVREPSGYREGVGIEYAFTLFMRGLIW